MGLLNEVSDYSQAFKDRLAQLVGQGATAFGSGLLNKGTPMDATAPGMEYKRYAAEQQAMGITPLPFEQWQMYMSQQK
ncbi:MAG: hypothetical protein KGL39_23735 [Patescibacteria group bacterium]|nr:hypothetical protein [Patescibacteria group bacterium]